MSDTEFDCEPKRQKRSEEEEEAEEDDETKKVQNPLLREEAVPSDIKSSSFVAETTNIKDIEVLFRACCKLDGVSTVLIVFDREGMQAMSLPEMDKAACVHLFYSKDRFRDYNVTTTHSYHLDAKKLVEFTQKLKHVELLSVHVINGSYAFKGTRRYPKGGVGEFMIFIDAVEDPKITSMDYQETMKNISSIVPELKVTASSSNFIQNCEFFKGKQAIEKIEIAISGNKLIIRSAASHGQYVQKEISQTLKDAIDTNVSFYLQRRYMDVLTICSEHLNESLNIRLKLNDINEWIHFMFELSTSDKSHFSLYVAPSNQD